LEVANLGRAEDVEVDHTRGRAGALNVDIAAVRISRLICGVGSPEPRQDLFGDMDAVGNEGRRAVGLRIQLVFSHLEAGLVEVYRASNRVGQDAPEWRFDVCQGVGV